MTENAASANDKHTLTLENQQRASLTGIISVESFNEKQVNVKTQTRYLIISGESLNVSKFNTENGTLVVEGNITEVRYTEKGKTAGIIKKIFK